MRPSTKSRDLTRTVLLVVVTTVWAVNFAAGILIKDYKPNESINGIFMIVIGAVFALRSKPGGDDANDS